jgi:hypothetical protein
MKRKKPPKEDGRIVTAADPKTADIGIVISQLREVNAHAPKVWTREGWRLLVQYHETGDAKHLRAFETHVLAIRKRIGVASYWKE